MGSSLVPWPRAFVAIVAAQSLIAAFQLYSGESLRALGSAALGAMFFAMLTGYASRSRTGRIVFYIIAAVALVIPVLIVLRR